MIMYLRDRDAYKLIAAVLEHTWNEYLEALKNIMKYREQYFTISSPKRDEQKVRLANRKNQDRHRSVTPKDKRVIYIYEEAVRQKIEIEEFYRSDRFQIYTLGKANPPDDIIKIAKRAVGYKDVNLYEYE